MVAFALSTVVVSERSLHADSGVHADVDHQADPVTVFYDALAPYGDWISTYEYGWVWVPSAVVVGADFVPYASAGQWVDTDAGWFFQSDYAWGWAPFHYGRWYFDDLRGWMWVPGRVWAAAWVDWRVGAGYVGWSPMPPRPIRGRRHQGQWVFVAETDLRRPHIHVHLLRRTWAKRAYTRTARVRRTRRVGDATIFRGPTVRARKAPGEGRRIRVVPPRRGVVGRVRIVDRAAKVEPMHARPGIVRPVDRHAVRRRHPSARGSERANRPGATRAKSPTRAIRKPVRVTAPPPSRRSARSRARRSSSRRRR